MFNVTSIVLLSVGSMMLVSCKSSADDFESFKGSHGRVEEINNELSAGHNVQVLHKTRWCSEDILGIKSIIKDKLDSKSPPSFQGLM